MKKFIAVLLSLLMIFSSLSVVAAAEDAEEEQGSLLDQIMGSVDFGQLGSSINIDFDIMSAINALASMGGFDVSGLVTADGIDMNEVVKNEELAKNLVLFPARQATEEEKEKGIDYGNGFTAYDLYYSQAPVFWNSLAGSTANGSVKSDLAVVKASINTYLLSLLKKIIGTVGDVQLYTAENAERFTNYIGQLINADFDKVSLKGDKYSTEDGFYSAVVELSGLANVIQLNWIDSPRVNYKSLLNALEFDYDDEALLGAYNKQKGDVIAKVLLKSIVKRVLEVGPLEYLLKVLSKMSVSYPLTVYEPVEALLHSHVACGSITTDELSTIKGLLNMLSNFNKKDAEHIQFIEAPVYRFASATKTTDSATKITTDTTDMFFYMLMYCNLSGMHKTNATDSDTGRIGGVDNVKFKLKSYLTKVKAMHEADPSIKDAFKVNENDIKVVDAVIGGFFQADLGKMLTALGTIVSTNIGDLKPNARRTLKEFFANIYKNIANFFDRILNSFLHFGQF